jgi:DNA-binding CsgD family transcriptional regulator
MLALFLAKPNSNHYTLSMAKRKTVLGVVPAKKTRNTNTQKHATGTGRILSTKNLLDIERRYQCVYLRRDGYTVQEIADSLGCSAGAVRNCLQEAFKETIEEYSETTEESRQIALDRIDSLIKVYTPLAKGYTTDIPDKDKPGQMKTVEVPPDISAAQFLLALETRRAKLLALDKPEVKKLEVSAIREYIGVDMEQV